MKFKYIIDNDITVVDIISPMMTLGQYLKSEGLTQVDFAERSGISQGNISMAVRGSLGLTLRMAQRIIVASENKVTICGLYAQAAGTVAPPADVIEADAA